MTEHFAEKVLIHYEDLTSLLAEIREMKRSVEEMGQSIAGLKDSLHLTPQKEYINRKQVASLFNVCVVTVDNWRDLGIIRQHQIGGVVRYILQEVLDAPTPIPTRKSSNENLTEQAKRR